MGPGYVLLRRREAILAEAPCPPGEVTHERVREDGSGFETVTVPRYVALLERLDRAVRAYHATEPFQGRPTPHQLAAYYQGVDSAAARLLKRIGAPNGDADAIPLAVVVDLRSEFEGLSRFLDDLLRLQTAAQKLAVLERRKGGGEPEGDDDPASDERDVEKVPEPPKRHRGDEALSAFVLALTEIWRDIYDREPSASVYEDAAGKCRGGPFVRFVRVVLLSQLAKVPTEQQIADRIKRLSTGGNQDETFLN